MGSRKASLRASRTFDKLERAAAVAGLQLIVEDGFFAIHGFAIFADDGLRDVFVADDVGGLFEEFVDELARKEQRVVRTREESRIGGAAE